MAPFRRPRLFKPSDGDGVAASTAASQTRPSTAPSVPPSSQTHYRLFGISLDKNATKARMKDAATAALELMQTGSRLAGDATGDVAIPGLSIGLKALAEVLRKVQTMDATITGVEELHERVVALDAALETLRSQAGGQPLPLQVIERMSKQEKKWENIWERAKKIKDHGGIMRFLKSDADAKALQGLIDEMNRSIQDDMLDAIQNIEAGIHEIRQRVETVIDGMAVVQSDMEVVREGVEDALTEAEAIHEDLEDVGEDVEVVLEKLSAVQDDVAVIGENVEVVLADLVSVQETVTGVGENVDAVRQVVEDGVVVLQEGVYVVAGNMEALRDEVEAVGVDVQELKLQVAKAIAATLDKSFLDRYAKMAPYNASDARQSCLEGTRVDFLQKIYARITVVCEQGERTPDGGIVLWINGLGGTGKTTVARTVAEWCAKKKILGGSFFCSRSDAGCSDPSLVFPTLSRHLCAHHGPFKDKVEAALKRDPDIVAYGLYRQFEELIVRPLEALDSPFPRSVFVIDALDELKDKGAKSTILLVIAKFVSRIAKFLLLVITSRPEERITALFEAARKDSLKASTTTLLMHDIPLEVALKDVRRYLDYGFADDIGVSAIQAGWPSDEEKDALASQSQGLFIYVVTAIKFIEDKAHGDPKGRLNLLRNPRPDSTDPQEFLSTLYSAIMVASCGNAAPALLDRIRKVLGAVVLAQEPLSPSALSLLLGFDEEIVRNALTRLHSVLYVPAESHKPVRIIHPTFPEFLLRSHNAVVFEPAGPTSEATALHIQPAEQHWYLFSRCLEVMSRGGALHRDMIGIRYPAMFQSEVDNRQERVTDAVKPHVSYSSRFWGHHLRDGIKGAATLDVSQPFHDFLHERLLNWIETCSLLDAMDKVIFALDVAWEVCQMPGGQFTDLSPFLADGRRFVVTYSPCIHAAPLQLYHSALSISPIASYVRTQYAHERKHALVVEHGASAGWAPCLDTIAGSAVAVAFSPDGSCFVTGGWDTKATIRKTATRTPVLSFDGHRGVIWCAAFPPGGLRVASGGDGEVCVWQVSSGEPVHTLKGHKDRVMSVAYSGDGHRIVSATRQGEVKLWDVADGRCLLTLDKRGNDTLQVGISPDGSVIAHGSGASVTLYDVCSATSEALEFPDAVYACTFSPDGRCIAARSKRVIRVWAWPENTVIRSINVPDNLTGKLAFSHDVTLIGCGSENGYVRLWPVASEDTPFILQGHTGSVHDLACSPDGSQVLSVADDGMIRVWDRTLSTSATAEHAAVDSPSRPAPGPPRFAQIQSGDKPNALLHLPTLGVRSEHLTAQSSYGAPTAMLFSDAVSAYDAVMQTVDDWNGPASARPWASLTGQQHTRLSWRPFTVSLDGSLMAYPSPADSDNNVVYVCNLRTGTVVATLTGHTERVRSIAFSPDNARIATGSEDHSVKVWDTLTGALLCGHTEHGGWTCAVGFSPDGRLVASGSGDRIVCVFEVLTKRVVHKLEPHRHHVMHVMFAADNAHLVALDFTSRVYVWDLATGACIREFSLQDHSHLRSPIFSPDGAGILVNGDDGAMRTVSLWKPGTRAWPAYHITEDGWVYALSPGRTRRLCWLPQEWRALRRFDGTKLYIGETKLAWHPRSKMVILDISEIVDYMDDLDASL